MHCPVTMKANLYQAFPAAATRSSRSLDMHGGISPSWLEELFRYYIPSSILRNLVNVR
jgi:hypothetical protein